MRRGILVLAAWLGAVAAAVVIAAATLNAVGSGILGPADPPVSQEDVAARLRQSPAPPPGGTGTGPAGSPNPSPSGTGPGQPSGGNGQEKSFGTAGGTVIARCQPNGAFLVRWIPAPGYVVSHVEQGPDDTPEVRFTSTRSGTEIRARIRCAGGVPTLSTEKH